MTLKKNQSFFRPSMSSLNFFLFESDFFEINVPYLRPVFRQIIKFDFKISGLIFGCNIFSVFLGKMFILKFSNTTPIAFMKPYFYYTLMFLSEKNGLCQRMTGQNSLWIFSSCGVVCKKRSSISLALKISVTWSIRIFFIIHKIYIF